MKIDLVKTNNTGLYNDLKEEATKKVIQKIYYISIIHNGYIAMYLFNLKIAI